MEQTTEEHKKTVNITNTLRKVRLQKLPTVEVHSQEAPGTVNSMHSDKATVSGFPHPSLGGEDCLGKGTSKIFG